MSTCTKTDKACQVTSSNFNIFNINIGFKFTNCYKLQSKVSIHPKSTDKVFLGRTKLKTAAIMQPSV